MPVSINFYYGLVTYFFGLALTMNKHQLVWIFFYDLVLDLKVIRDFSMEYANHVFKKSTHLFTETEDLTSTGIPTIGIPRTYLRRYAIKP